MAGNLKTAIEHFPLVRWLSDKTSVRETDSEDLYVDCPVCGGHRKFGIHRFKKIGHCFKCDDGGEGGTTWNGRADLLRIVQLFDRCSRRDAVETIFRLSGIPDFGFSPKEIPQKQLPSEAVPLTDCNPQHPAYQMLLRRCDHLVATSHVAVSGRYSYRVILPVHWFGELLGFDAKSYMQAIPKSLFPAWQAAGAMHATAAWDHSQDFCVITESVLDAETLGVNAIGLCGSVLRDAQLCRLLELREQGVDRLVWFLDYDAWRKQCQAVFRKTGRFRNYVVPLLADADPNSLGREEAWRLVGNAVPIRDELDLVRLEFSMRA